MPVMINVFQTVTGRSDRLYFAQVPRVGDIVDIPEGEPIEPSGPHAVRSVVHFPSHDPDGTRVEVWI